MVLFNGRIYFSIAEPSKSLRNDLKTLFYTEKVKSCGDFPKRPMVFPSDQVAKEIHDPINAFWS